MITDLYNTYHPSPATGTFFVPEISVALCGGHVHLCDALDTYARHYAQTVMANKKKKKKKKRCLPTVNFSSSRSDLVMRASMAIC